MAGIIILLVGGGLLAAYARQQNLVVMWATSFQLVFSIYLSIMLVSPIVKQFGGKGAHAYYYAATLLLLGMIFFLGMLVAVKLFWPSIYEVRFPRLIDSVGAILLGFASGTLIASFLVLVFSVTPPSRGDLALRLSVGKDFHATALAPMRAACRIVGYLSFQSDPESGPNNAKWLVRRSLIRSSQLLPPRANSPQSDESMPPKFPSPTTDLPN